MSDMSMSDWIEPEERCMWAHLQYARWRMDPGSHRDQIDGWIRSRFGVNEVPGVSPTDDLAADRRIAELEAQLLHDEKVATLWRTRTMEAERRIAELEALAVELAEALRAFYPRPEQFSECDGGLMALARFDERKAGR